jgi:hypothetical protein
LQWAHLGIMNRFTRSSVAGTPPGTGERRAMAITRGAVACGLSFRMTCRRAMSREVPPGGTRCAGRCDARGRSQSARRGIPWQGAL